MAMQWITNPPRILLSADLTNLTYWKSLMDSFAQSFQDLDSAEEINKVTDQYVIWFIFLLVQMYIMNSFIISQIDSNRKLFLSRMF